MHSSPNLDMNKEVKVLKELTERKFEGFSTIISHGLIKNKVIYIVMCKYGPSLKQMLRRSKHKRFSLKTAVQICL
jgi:hypothetical protein